MYGSSSGSLILGSYTKNDPVYLLDMSTESTPSPNLLALFEEAKLRKEQHRLQTKPARTKALQTLFSLLREEFTSLNPKFIWKESRDADHDVSALRLYRVSQGGDCLRIEVTPCVGFDDSHDPEDQRRPRGPCLAVTVHQRSPAPSVHYIWTQEHLKQLLPVLAGGLADGEP